MSFSFDFKLNCTIHCIFLVKSIDKHNTSNPENSSVANDSYILTFMTEDFPLMTEKDRRMTVNNNFNSEQLGSNQVYVERGSPQQGGPPPNNIQLLSPNQRG